MPRVKKLDLGMTALDELFMNDKERAENKLPKIFDIPLSEIDDFPDMGVLSFLSTVKMAFLAKLLQYLHSPLCDLPSIVPGKAARAFQCVHEEARLQGLA